MSVNVYLTTEDKKVFLKEIDQCKEPTKKSIIKSTVEYYDALGIPAF